MKKNLFLLIFLTFFGCVAPKHSVIVESCPEVLFSKEHKKYISLDDNLENPKKIEYTAELNNFSYDTECFVANNKLFSKISILFVVNSIDDSEGIIFLPYYIATVNSEDKLIDIQYYSIIDEFDQSIKNEEYLETEVISTTTINIPYFNSKKDSNNYLLLGFMLNKSDIKILN